MQGAGVCKHLAQRFTEMEHEMAVRDSAYEIANAAARPSCEAPKSHELAEEEGVPLSVAGGTASRN